MPALSSIVSRVGPGYPPSCATSYEQEKEALGPFLPVHVTVETQHRSSVTEQVCAYAKPLGVFGAGAVAGVAGSFFVIPGLKFGSGCGDTVDQESLQSHLQQYIVVIASGVGVVGAVTGGLLGLYWGARIVNHVMEGVLNATPPVKK